ncbi:hypothetical protein CAEBREN_07902 [Caenorhabditis brenneri]|uniref:Uncharacterized protein n=1 Tax=Caenorhabditis brenneri TaxID=135651 RepID=G0P4U2_CAEBE|nr:hypothetical protein CAEBREN_07902 [Caenorhabditis brenneri]
MSGARAKSKKGGEGFGDPLKESEEYGGRVEKEATGREHFGEGAVTHPNEAGAQRRRRKERCRSVRPDGHSSGTTNATSGHGWK